jgi:predicted small lipoprotein YifL
MKNAFKTIIAAVFISLSVASCSGDSSKRLPDTVQADSMKGDTTRGGTEPGTNGSTAPIDSGFDKSGSGGTDSIKKAPL